PRLQRTPRSRRDSPTPSAHPTIPALHLRVPHPGRGVDNPISAAEAALRVGGETVDPGDVGGPPLALDLAVLGEGEGDGQVDEDLELGGTRIHQVRDFA